MVILKTFKANNEYVHAHKLLSNQLKRQNKVQSLKALMIQNSNDRFSKNNK